MSRLIPQWRAEGWRPHGPGFCRCPDCGGISATNAFARSKHKCPTIESRDVNGVLLQIGDKVRQVEFGPDAIVRDVLAVADRQVVAGYVTVSGLIGWHHGRRFEKVQS